MIALRKLFRVFGRGTIEFFDPANRKILAYMRRGGQDEQILCVANLSRFAQPFELDLSAYAGLMPIEMLGYVEFPKITAAPYSLTLGPYGFLWFELHGELETQAGEKLEGQEFTLALKPSGGLGGAIWHGRTGDPGSVRVAGVFAAPALVRQQDPKHPGNPREGLGLFAGFAGGAHTSCKSSTMKARRRLYSVPLSLAMGEAASRGARRESRHDPLRSPKGRRHRCFIRRDRRRTGSAGPADCYSRKRRGSRAPPDDCGLARAPRFWSTPARSRTSRSGAAARNRATLRSFSELASS